MTKHTATPPGTDSGTDSGDETVGYCYYSRNGMVAHIYCTDCVDDHNPTNTKVAISNRPVYGGPVPHLFCDDCGQKMTGGDD